AGGRGGDVGGTNVSVGVSGTRRPGGGPPARGGRLTGPATGSSGLPGRRHPRPGRSGTGEPGAPAGGAGDVGGRPRCGPPAAPPPDGETGGALAGRRPSRSRTAPSRARRPVDRS